jgi:hypothetical protein
VHRHPRQLRAASRGFLPQIVEAIQSDIDLLSHAPGMLRAQRRRATQVVAACENVRRNPALDEAQTRNCCNRVANAACGTCVCAARFGPVSSFTVQAKTVSEESALPSVTKAKKERNTASTLNPR